MTPQLTQERAWQVVRYCFETGDFFHVIGTIRRPSGTRAQTPAHKGYYAVRIDGQKYYAHRLAWFMVYGDWPKYIDHINCNPSDNRICNLRAATNQLNNANKGKNKNNTTGFKGVSLCKETGRYIARIGYFGKYINLGRFNTPEEAYEVYCAAANRLFGEFARAA